MIEVFGKSITVLSGSCLFSKAVGVYKRDARLGVSREASAPCLRLPEDVSSDGSLILTRSV